jgi:hypothetical protein
MSKAGSNDLVIATSMHLDCGPTYAHHIFSKVYHMIFLIVANEANIFISKSKFGFKMKKCHLNNPFTIIKITHYCPRLSYK